MFCRRSRVGRAGACRAASEDPKTATRLSLGPCALRRAALCRAGLGWAGLCSPDMNNAELRTLANV